MKHCRNPRPLVIFLLPTADWIKRMWTLAIDHDGLLMFTSFAFTCLTYIPLIIANVFWDSAPFGTTNFVLALVIVTVFVNTYYGIQRSRKREGEIRLEMEDPSLTDEQLLHLEGKARMFAFDPKRLQFTFFKCFTLLGYLFFVKSLLDDGGTFFDFTTEVLCKAPVAIFWYYEFKSIGENSTYVYGRRASIFKIVEMIFEPRLMRFFGGKNDEV